MDEKQVSRLDFLACVSFVESSQKAELISLSVTALISNRYSRQTPLQVPLSRDFSLLCRLKPRYFQSKSDNKRTQLSASYNVTLRYEVDPNVNVKMLRWSLINAKAPRCLLTFKLLKSPPDLLFRFVLNFNASQWGRRESQLLHKLPELKTIPNFFPTNCCCRREQMNLK